MNHESHRCNAFYIHYHVSYTTTIRFTLGYYRISKNRPTSLLTLTSTSLDKVFVLVAFYRSSTTNDFQPQDYMRNKVRFITQLSLVVARGLFTQLCQVVIRRHYPSYIPSLFISMSLILSRDTFDPEIRRIIALTSVESVAHYAEYIVESSSVVKIFLMDSL